jgi:hypothetical protein
MSSENIYTYKREQNKTKFQSPKACYTNDACHNKQKYKNNMINNRFEEGGIGRE